MRDAVTDLLTKYAGSADRLRVRSALNPFLWLAGVVTLPSLGVAAVTVGLVQYAAIALAATPVAVCVFVGLRFAFTEPDKLRSEEHERFKEALGLIERKGGAVSISDASVAATTDAYRTLPSAKRKSDDQESN